MILAGVEEFRSLGISHIFTALNQQAEAFSSALSHYACEGGLKQTGEIITSNATTKVKDRALPPVEYVKLHGKYSVDAKWMRRSRRLCAIHEEVHGPYLVAKEMADA